MMKKIIKLSIVFKKSRTFAASLVTVHRLTSERANALIYGRK